MSVEKTNRLLRDVKEELSEGEVFNIGAGGLTPVVTGKMTMMPGVMYPMGASSSPDIILMTQVKDKFLRYKHHPWTKGTPERGIERNIGEDLIYTATKTWLKSGYPKYQPAMAKSLRSMLKGGKGKKENLANLEQVTILAAPAVSGDLWRAAEQYGSVGGMTHPDTGVMHYEITGRVSDLKKIKKDKRFKVLKTVKGHNRIGF